LRLEIDNAGYIPDIKDITKIPNTNSLTGKIETSRHFNLTVQEFFEKRNPKGRKLNSKKKEQYRLEMLQP